jgi:hypothetical protein
MKKLTIAKYSALALLVLLAFAMLPLVSGQAQDPPIEIIPPRFPVPDPNAVPDPPAEDEEAAIVVIAASAGGTTDPEPGTYKYAFAATITLEAMPNSGYRFLYWSISGSYTPGHNQPPINYPVNFEEDPDWVPDFPPLSEANEDSLTLSQNPLQIVCGYGYTYVYQPVFVPTTTQTPTTNVAVVNVLDSVGGSTNPTPGTYTYMEGSTIDLQATPDSGYTFLYWVAVGEDGHPTTLVDNPANIECGYGYTYSYQPMFAPEGTTQDSMGIPAEYLYAIIVALAVIAVILLVLVVMYRGKTKK